MSSNGESIAPPLVRGARAAAITLGTVLALVAVPALAAQVAGGRADATALDAILVALDILVLGHGGSLLLTTGVVDGAVSLTPLGLLGLLLLLSAVSLRRVGRALQLVREDGMLRERALRDAGAGLATYAVLYALGIGILAAVARSTVAAPVVPSAVVSALMVAVLGGLAGILWSLRRRATETVPGVRVLDLLPAPYGDVARAAGGTILLLLAAGLALCALLAALSIPGQGALYGQLAPGVVGAVVLVLIQLALLPSLAVWALVVLLGGTVGVGTSTGISLAGSQTGVLPALPILAALPEPGGFPDAARALLLVPIVIVAVGAMRLVRAVRDLGRRERVTAWIGYPVAVIVGVLLLAGLSTGSLGEGRLAHLGPVMGSLLLPLLGVVLGATAAVLAVLATPLVPWSRALIARLRERVETAEAAEADHRTAAAEAAEADHRTAAAEGTVASRPAGEDAASRITRR